MLKTMTVENYKQAFMLRNFFNTSYKKNLSNKYSFEKDINKSYIMVEFT